MRHNLLEGLKLINKLDFVNLSKVTTSTIEHFNIYGNNRYFTNPYFEDGLRLFNLDFTVWELRDIVGRWIQNLLMKMIKK